MLKQFAVILVASFALHAVANPVGADDPPTATVTTSSASPSVTLVTKWGIVSNLFSDLEVLELKMVCAVRRRRMDRTVSLQSVHLGDHLHLSGVVHQNGLRTGFDLLCFE